MHRHFVAELISHIALVEMKLTKRPGSASQHDETNGTMRAAGLPQTA